MKERKTPDGETGTGNMGQVPVGEVWRESIRRQI